MRDPAMPGVPSVLQIMRPIIDDRAAAPSAVVWRLADARRQLDANMLNLPQAGRSAPTPNPILTSSLATLSGTRNDDLDDGPLERVPRVPAVWPATTARPAASLPAPRAALIALCTGAGQAFRSTPGRVWVLLDLDVAAARSAVDKTAAIYLLKVFAAP
jgi:hypothetical protein